MWKEDNNKPKVIITTYVESSKKLSHVKKYDKLKRMKPKPFSNKAATAKSQGYDRKAQLLAYANELRHPNSQHLDHFHSSTSDIKKRRSWIPSPARFQKSVRQFFDRTKGPWRYERINSSKENGIRSYERFGYQEIKKINIRSNGIRNSQFCRRLRKLLKHLSSACNCKPRPT